MSEDTTIANAAEAALRSLGRPASSQEIFAEIERLNLYKFNTPVPVHVLETTLKRHATESNRSDKRDTIFFKINPDNTYEMTASEKTSGRRNQSVGMKRILRAADKEDLIEELMGSGVGVFREIWRLLLFAAQVGQKANRREPLRSTETGKGIDQATFGNAGSWPGILYLMGLSEVGDSSVLAGTAESEEERVQIFQEYANGGLSIIREFFKSRTLDLDGILAFIEVHQGKNTELSEPDLDLSI